jgi:glutathione S-transferase
MTKLIKEDIRTEEVFEWRGLNLIHFSGSSCSQKTRIFLNLKGIDWVSHHVDLTSGKNHSDWFLGINPRGLVPILVDDGEVHIESNDIIQYLEEKFPEPKLIPEGYKTLTSELLKEEDDLHLDIRNVSFRFLFGKLARKRPSSIKKFEDYEGTIEGKRDSHKVKEVNFYNDFLKQGIPVDALKQSVTKFIKVYERFEQDLANQEFLLGEEVSVLDIAWFIYTHRLDLAGYDFKKRHRAVYNWYLNLLGKEAFKKEIEEPFILKAVRSSIRLKDIVSGSTLKHLSS